MEGSLRQLAQPYEHGRLSRSRIVVWQVRDGGCRRGVGTPPRVGSIINARSLLVDAADSGDIRDVVPPECHSSTDEAGDEGLSLLRLFVRPIAEEG